MPESANIQDRETHKSKKNSTSLVARAGRYWRMSGGAVGVAEKAIHSGQGVLDTVLYGGPRDEDPTPPRTTFSRSDFVLDTITDKEHAIDDRKRGRRREYDQRKPLEVKVDEVYPLMRKFWVVHIDRLGKLFQHHPHLLNDKTSYLYAQYLTARTLTTNAGSRMLGEVDYVKLDAYFQTPAGYNETMRYMEEELMRLEQANNVVTLLKNGYKPDGTDLIQAGEVKGRDWAQATAVFGAGAMSTFAAVVAVGRVLSSLSVITPTLVPALTSIAPWIPAVMVGHIGVKLTFDKMKYILNLGKSRDIMADCTKLFHAMKMGPEYESERAYLREVYGIDPGELRFTQGSDHAGFALEGITTSNWEGSKQLIYDIKETRRIFYEQVCGIKESDKYGVPEEAFFDINGKYRKQILPEGRGVIYAQEVWDRFKDLGGYTVIDDAQNGVPRAITPIEAIQRFQRARREVIFESVQDRAESIIAEDRKTGFTEAEAIITKKKRDIGVDGEVRKQEKKTITDEIALLKSLDEGAEGKPGLKAYVDGWKSGEGSLGARLGQIDKLRKEIYEKVIQYVVVVKPIHEVGIAEVAEAISILEGVKGDTSSGLIQERESIRSRLNGIPTKTARQEERTAQGKTRTVNVYEDNPEYKIVSEELKAKEDEIKKVNDQITELKSLQTKLQSELARYDVRGEHGVAFSENLKKMQSAYTLLVSSAANRGGKGIDLTETRVAEILRTYPDGTFTVQDPATKKDVLRSGTLADLMKTLANEAVPPLWKEELNDSFNNQMTVLYAVAYARARARIDSLGQSGGVGDREYVVGGKKIHDVFVSGLTDGKFNEMTILARNEVELKQMGTVLGVDMKDGDNTALSTYARTRLDIYVDTLQELVEKHRRDTETLTKQGAKIDEKYESALKQYVVVEELINREKGNEQAKKISSQVHRRRLTGDTSVGRLTDTKTYAKLSEEEQQRFYDYERHFLLEHPSFPPAMLEFLDVVFQFRSDSAGRDKLNSIYEVLRQLGQTGATKLDPHIVLADMIYNSHPSIRNTIRITRDQGIKGYKIIDKQGNVIDTITWDTIVLMGFRLRHTGFQYQGGHPLYVSAVRHPYSAMEMNAIFTSIHDQIIEKVVKNGVTIV